MDKKEIDKKEIENGDPNLDEYVLLGIKFKPNHYKPSGLPYLNVSFADPQRHKEYHENAKKLYKEYDPEFYKKYYEK